MLDLTNVNRVIFLDIDGCLTSMEDFSYFNPDPEKYHPSLKLINKVKALCTKTGAKVIMSTNWRKFDVDGTWKNQYGVYKNPLPETMRWFGNYCLGTLPKTRHINKSQALILWLKETSYTGKFVIFDDDFKEQFQNTSDFGIMDMFIHINPQYGITDDDILKAKRILTNDE